MNLSFDATVLEFPATGVAKVTLGLYAACQLQDRTLNIVAIHRRSLLSSLPEGIRSSQGGRFLPPTLWRQLHLPAVAMLEQNPVVHFPWNGNVPWLPDSIRVITTLHDVLPLIIPGYFAHTSKETEYRKARQADIARTDLLLTDSEFSKREILKNFRVGSEPVVIPFGPTIAVDVTSSRRAGPGKYFLYVGGYSPRKGLVELVSTFLELHREGRIRSKLVLTGSKLDISAKFRQLVDSGVRMGVLEELGYVSDPELVSLYMEAIALVYPSRYEGFGLPPLESMALGCPVITTNCTSLPEVCGNAAYYIDPGDPATIGKALLELEANPELRATLSAKGKEQATKFTWERAASTFLTALEQATTTSTAQRRSRQS